MRDFYWMDEHREGSVCVEKLVIMPAEKIDWQRLAREADEYADTHLRPFARERSIWQQTRDEHFARLVLQYAAEVCAQMPFDSTPRQCSEALESRMP